MAGALAGFDPAEFRAAIHAVQEMAMPTVDTDRPTFHFPPVYAPDATVDEENVPFDPMVQRLPASQRPPVQVLCGVRFMDRDGELTNLGQVAQTLVELSLLDTEYALVDGFDIVTLGEDRYAYRYTKPPRGLGPVGIYQVIVAAEDET